MLLFVVLKRKRNANEAMGLSLFIDIIPHIVRELG
jgi:hypothetical protein